jgi:hypothetical protein
MWSWFVGIFRFFHRGSRPSRSRRQPMKPRITCILGAGATIPIGGSTVASLTEDVCQKLQRTRDEISGDWHDVPFLSEVRSRLNEFLAPAESNFEDILHALETLDSYRSDCKKSSK